MKQKNSAGLGILDGLKIKRTQEEIEAQVNTKKPEDARDQDEDLRSQLEVKEDAGKETPPIKNPKEPNKRSFTLTPANIKKLQELKLLVYPSYASYNNIVNDAIELLYEAKKK